MEDDQQNTVGDSDDGMRPSSGSSPYDPGACLLPKKPIPVTLREAIDCLIFILERHRLHFLYFAHPVRVNRLSTADEASVYETICKDEILGWADFVAQIDSKGEFLFQNRWILDEFADKAVGRFGHGEGCKPNVDGGSYPNWVIEEGGPSYLQESSDSILEAATHVRAMDYAGEFDGQVKCAVESTHDCSEPRWSSSILVSWQYLSKLDDTIANTKRQRVLHGKGEKPRAAINDETPQNVDPQPVATANSRCSPTAEQTSSQPVGKVEQDNRPTGSLRDARDESAEPEPFSEGTMVFFQNRVELCGVDICSGSQSQRRREALDLLRLRKGDNFVAYSGEELAEKLRLTSGQNSAAGLVRDLRRDIKEALLDQANIQCGDEDVILSRGRGYRFSEKLSVQDGDDSGTTEITDTDDTSDAPNIPNVPNVRNGDVRDVRNDDVPNVGDDAAGKRRTWILKRLRDGDELQAPAVAKQFKCSVKTAQRDLRALKGKGVIEFIGAPRTGYYRLRNPPESSE